MTGDHRNGHGPLAFLHFDRLVEDFSTRRSDTRTVARFVYMPIRACNGGITRICSAMKATKVPTVMSPRMTRIPP